MNVAEIVGFAVVSTVAFELFGCSGQVYRANNAASLRTRPQCVRYDASLDRAWAQVARTRYVMIHAGVSGLAPTDPPSPVDCARFNVR